MRRRKSRGIITVFVTLIMVPVVAFTGTMVDVARLKLYSSQAAMAADSYGEVVLSEYDNLLKELYGLFAVTQNEAGKQAIEDLAKYTEYSFKPNGDNEDLTGFMPYKDAEVNISYTPVDGASLSNNNVLMTQVSDFMRFRVIEELLQESNILGAIEGFDGMSNDMEAVEDRTDITKSSEKALKHIGYYYNHLDAIAHYPEYLTWIKGNYASYSKVLKDIYDSDEYEAYVNYLDNKEEIDAAVKAVEDAEEADQKAKEEAEEAGETFDESTGEVANLSEETKELAEEYVDADEFEDFVDEKIGSKDDLSKYNSSYKVNFGDIEQKVADLITEAQYLDSNLENLKEKVTSLRAKLPNCSENLREGIEEEIKDLEDILEVSDEFWRTANLLDEKHNAIDDIGNKNDYDDAVDNLDEVKCAILDGEQEEYDWSPSISFEWFDFETQDERSNDLYVYLEKLCNGGMKVSGESGSVDADEEAGDDEIKRANKKTEAAKESLSEDEKTDARNISSSLAKQLEGSTSTAEIPDMEDCFSGSASVASLGNGAIGKFLLTTYDFGMFSSRVSGTEKPKEEDAGAVATPAPAEGEEKEEYFDQSLTKVKMSGDVNYLYGAEIEYLIGGYRESKQNLNFTRNIICGVRLVANFASTYSVSEVNTAINTIAATAEAAVAATVVGAPAAPLVRVAVSGALRMAVATLETVGDWDNFKAREDVVLYKTTVEDMAVYDTVIEPFLSKGNKGKKSGTTKTSVSIKMDYEDYLYIIMLLFVDEDTLLDRTSNLITLNVNQAMNSEEELKTLNFKMGDTVTAIKSTCEVNMKFVVVPENFVNMFISGSDTEAVIQKLDDGSYGYSVIRGY